MIYCSFSEVKKLINLLETKEGWSARRSRKFLKKKRTGKTGDEYDVFLSYRVAADQKLVEELYWRLVGMKVMDNGRERNLRVFWDKKCLRSGESWEVCCCSCPVLCSAQRYRTGMFLAGGAPG